MFSWFPYGTVNCAASIAASSGWLGPIFHWSPSHESTFRYFNLHVLYDKLKTVPRILSSSLKIIEPKISLLWSCIYEPFLFCASENLKCLPCLNCFILYLVLIQWKSVCNHPCTCILLRSLRSPTGPRFKMTWLWTRPPSPHLLMSSGCLKMRGTALQRWGMNILPHILPGGQGHTPHEVSP